MLTGVRRYLVESWAELKKVAWPTRSTVINLTLIVIAFLQFRPAGIVSRRGR